jgi:hypothetical protein
MEKQHELSLKTVIIGLVILVLAVVAFVWIIRMPASYKRVVVAKVNSQEITDADVQEMMNLASPWFKNSGVDITDRAVNDKMKKEALAVLVDDALMAQDAQTLGISTSTEAIEGAYNQAIASFPSKDEFTKSLGEIGLTEEGLHKKIADQMLIETYLENRLSLSTVSASDAEINAIYPSVASQLPAGQSEADSRNAVKDAIIKQKIQSSQTQLLAELRDKATVWIDSNWQ